MKLNELNSQNGERLKEVDLASFLSAQACAQLQTEV